MGIAISGTVAVNDNQKGIFRSVQPGQYTNNNRPSSPVAGDIIYNTEEEEVQYWDGTKWVRMGGAGTMDDSIITMDSYYAAVFEDSGGTTVVPQQRSSASYFPACTLGRDGGLKLQATLFAPASFAFGVPVPTIVYPNYAISDGGDGLFMNATQSQGGTNCMVKVNGKTNQILWNSPWQVSTSAALVRARVTSTGDVVGLIGEGGSNGAYIIKFNGSSGALQWCRKINGSPNSGGAVGGNNGVPYDMVIDSSDNAYFFVMDNWRSSVQKIYVGGTGNPTSVWGRETSGTLIDTYAGVGGGIDSAGNVYLSSYAETAQNNGAPGKPMMITKLNSAGSPVWQRSLSQGSMNMGGRTVGALQPKVIAVDKSGNIYASFQGTITSGNTYPGGIVAKINTDGNLVWTRMWFYNDYTRTPASTTIVASAYIRNALQGDNRCGFVITTGLKNQYSGQVANAATTNILSIPPDGRISQTGGLTMTVEWLDSGPLSVSNVSQGMTSKSSFSSISATSGVTWAFTPVAYSPDAWAAASPWPLENPL